MARSLFRILHTLVTTDESEVGNDADRIIDELLTEIVENHGDAIVALDAHISVEHVNLIEPLAPPVAWASLDGLTRVSSMMAAFGISNRASDEDRASAFNALSALSESIHANMLYARQLEEVLRRAHPHLKGKLDNPPGPKFECECGAVQMASGVLFHAEDCELQTVVETIEFALGMEEAVPA